VTTKWQYKRQVDDATQACISMYRFLRNERLAHHHTRMEMGSLLENLLPYVRHSTNCAQISGECTCGLQAVLDASFQS